MPERGSPRIQVEIEPRYVENLVWLNFDGIQVSGTMPELFYGMDTAYFIEADGVVPAERGAFRRSGASR